MTEPIEGSASHRLSRRSVSRALIALAITAVAFAITLLFGFREIEEFDFAARDISAQSRDSVSSDSIVLVTINDADYSSLFGGVSPLDADTLARLVQTALDRGARVVGVDIETSHHSFARALPFATQHRDRVVWARDATPCASESEPVQGHEPQERCRAGEFVSLDVLGSSDTVLKARGIGSGLVVSQLDSRGTVRYYTRRLATSNGSVETFTELLANTFVPTRVASADTTARFINFHPGRSGSWELTASSVLRLPPGSEVLSNKVVLIGGTYSAARDGHATPVGPLAGVKIQAQTLETELRGGGSLIPSRRLLIMTEILAGATVVLLLLALPIARAGLVMLVMLPVVTMAASWMATGSLVDGAMYFAPFLVLLVLHHLYEEAIHWRTRWLEETYRQTVMEREEAERPLSSVVERLDDVALSSGQRLMLWIRSLSRARKARQETSPPTDTGVSEPDVSVVAPPSGTPSSTSAKATAAQSTGAGSV